MKPEPNRNQDEPRGHATVRCSDVTQELSAPTGVLHSSALAAHLASCPTCAAWSARAERFDRAWDATRPDEPAGGFDTLWARVCQALEAPQTVLAISEARSRRRRWVIAVAGVAQAAVLLVAVLVVFNRVDRDAKNGPKAGDSIAQSKAFPTGIQGELKNASLPRIDIPEGQLGFYRVGDNQVKFVDLPPMEMEPSSTVAFDIDLFNYFESIAPVTQ
jgi:hypothetical protein